MAAMWGWFSDASKFRFAREAREAVGVMREHLGQDLIATSRSNFVSRARTILTHPASPIAAVIS